MVDSIALSLSDLHLMQDGIHPTYYPDAKIVCACGKTFSVGSTVKELHVEICSNCHPFYTGKQKLVDAARRVERFQTQSDKKSTVATARKGRKAKRAKLEVRKSKTAKSARPTPETE